MTRLIPVLDRVNTKRLLGHMDVSEFNRPHNHYTVHYLVQDEPRYREPWSPFVANTRQVRLHVEHVPSADGWDVETIFLTDAPLEDLMKLRQFRPITGRNSLTAYEKAREELERLYQRRPDLFHVNPALQFPRYPIAYHL
ncbi:hypothetical protein ABIE64_002631 [Thalassospira sp. MBR-102]|jgi:hypothetical protein|uniref:hypothetical protein n=1 Tax=Thalassospira sp. MBR-102 TaxID=3156466 RepID=UPI003398E33B